MQRSLLISTGAIVGLLLLALAGCNKAESHIHDISAGQARTFAGEYPITVVCTTGQVAEMVSRIGGEHLAVEALMGPGVDPHLFKPRSSHVAKLHECNAIFYSGLHLEGRMSDLFVQMARNKATYAVTEGLQTRHDSRLREPPEFAGMYDPHVWHDPAIWADCAHDVAGVLGKFDPDHAEQYDANAHRYIEELHELDEFCKLEIAKIPEARRVMVTAHDAFGYFGKAYGLEVYGLKGISSEEEIDLAHHERIQAMIIERKIPAVFVETAIAPRTIEALVEPCRAAGWDLKVAERELFADALGEPDTDAATYAGMIRQNVDTIVTALSAE